MLKKTLIIAALSAVVASGSLILHGLIKYCAPRILPAQRQKARPDPIIPLDPQLETLQQKLKQQFDPKSIFNKPID